SWSSLLASETVTFAPRDCKNSAEATPERPRPTTRTRLLFSSKCKGIHHGRTDATKFILHRYTDHSDRVNFRISSFVRVNPRKRSCFPPPRDYRSFNVVNANSAKISDAIQKRTMIFDS